MTAFDFDVNRVSLHVVSSCATNIGPIVFISVRGDHARERECADPLFSPLPVLDLEEGLPRAPSATKYDFRPRSRLVLILRGDGRRNYCPTDEIRWAIPLAPMRIVSRHFAHVL
jgi:hypothetical protein